MSLRYPLDGHLTPDQYDALQGTENVPSDVNRFVTHADTRLSAATQIKDGLMTFPDKIKLDGIEALADVTDSTNVAAAGAVMESDTTTALMSFVIDEDTMASNLATKVPTQQSVKAYADTYFQALTWKDAANGYCGLDANAKIAAARLYLADAAGVTITDSTGAVGTSTDLAREDHTHGHGNRGGGSLHSLVTQSTAGFASAADKVIIDSALTTTNGTIGLVQVDSYRTQLDTTSVTYVLYRSFTTSSVPAGTYRIGWTYQWAGSSTASSVDIEVRLDGNPIDLVIITPRSNTDRNSSGGFYYVTTGTTATHTISIYVKSGSSGKTSTLYQSDLEFWRAYV